MLPGTAGRVFAVIAALVVIEFVGLIPGLLFPAGAAVNQPPFREGISAALTIAGALWFIRLLQTKLEKRAMAEVGLSGPARACLLAFLLGSAMGAIAVALVPLLQYAAGAIRFDRFLWEAAAAQGWVRPFWIFPVGGLFKFAAVGVVEELLFRGYLQTALQRRHGVKAAVVVSALVFALAHFVNPGYAPLAFLNTLIVAVLLSLMFLFHASLWPVIGFHFAWDWVQTHLLQVAIHPSFGPRGFLVFKPEPGANSLLSGVPYGPEGTVFATVILLALLIGYYGATRRRLGVPGDPGDSRDLVRTPGQC